MNHPLLSVLVATLGSLFLPVLASLAQYPADVDSSWHLQDPRTSPYVGAAVLPAWEKLDRMVPKDIVVVAVIDDGTEFGHYDLFENAWENMNEEPFNDLDDDGNGYVDDVYGWNFLVDSTGESIIHARYQVPWAVHLADSLTERGEALPAWLDAATLGICREYMEELETDQWYNGQFAGWAEWLGEAFEEAMGRELRSLEEVVYWKKELPLRRSDVKLVKTFLKDGWAMQDFEELTDDYWNGELYHLNPNYNPRSATEPERGYGSLYSATSSSNHGTHVSGIIGASRDNDGGVNGVAGGVCQIMPLRAVPDGDELDKDVANAIRYAVDNGAKLINMSFGKPLSPQRDLVMSAMRYAAENDVLMVHAAGNDAVNADLVPSYPNVGDDELIQSCFLSVGATTAFSKELLVADFSNYGPTTVDLFAPGDEIYSLANDNETMWMGGTSMAAPVVTGVAALIRAYFPTLSAAEVKTLLVSTVYQPEGEFLLPGSGREKVPFSELCRSGGVVNADNAVNQALILASQQR